MHVAEQEISEKLGEWSSPQPGPHGIEHHLTVSVGVSLPPTDFVVDSKGHHLLELLSVVSSISSDPSS
jgi:hypothetical protein